MNTPDLSVDPNVWTLIPGTEWEVYQRSGQTIILGDFPNLVSIRRRKKR